MSLKYACLLSVAALTLAGCGKEATPPACTSDSQCVAGQKCDTATGTCVATAGADAAVREDASTVLPDAGSCDYPCGEECCTETQGCRNETCVECSCEGKSCGDNGCGTSCGKCSSGKTCNSSGQCVTVKTDAGTPGDAATDRPDASVSRPDAGPVECASARECPLGMACDLTKKTCVTYCGATQACNGGCCSTNGQCTLRSDTACGTATCIDCTGNKSGQACLNTRCGCNTAEDCLPGYSCNPATLTCTSACSDTQPCNDACCDLTRKVCLNQSTACGNKCVNCASQSANKACVAGVCGCTVAADCAVGGSCGLDNLCNGCSSAKDCPVGMACTGGACTRTCTGSGTCNSACCASLTCSNTAEACGPSCINCPKASPTKPACLSTGVCGCAKASDCPTGQACYRGVCGTYCDPTTGVTCNGGCCSGKACVTGKALSACGGNGAACDVCSSKEVCCATDAPRYFCASSIVCLF